MRRPGLTGSIVLACGFLIGAASSGSVTASVGAGHGVVEVSGSAIPNSAEVVSISCVAPGECAAGGDYSYYGPANQLRYSQAFVVDEADGSWGNPIEVPGTETVNRGGHAEVDSISCAAVGECAAAGDFTDDLRDKDGFHDTHAFVASETDGTWGTAIEVTGMATFNRGDPTVESISCPAAGDCVAGGSFYAGHGNEQAFVVGETNGSWGKAIAVPGIARLNRGGYAAVDSISCAAAGECSAGGGYTGGGGAYQAFVVGEKNGRWGNAIEVLGTARLNKGGDAVADSISCATVGECGAGGSYTDSRGRHAFVADETNGRWGKAIEVPGTARLNNDGVAEADSDSISCAAAGDCVAGGLYTGGSGAMQAFVVGETNGIWGKAIEVPGTAALNTGGFASVESISCAAAGDCAAGGYYAGPGSSAAFVVSETNGAWGNAIEVPGTESTVGVGASVGSVSCTAAGECAAGGSYTDSFGRPQGFVVTETNTSWGTAIPVSNFPASCRVPNLHGKGIHAAEKTLKAADCRLGKITKAYSIVKKGRIIAQQPKRGTTVNAGTRVSLTVSKGKKT